ncbi:MAG: hypothetical protein H0U74_12155 [Bradymonadaceae bacterium]|nr:hypothetical protein [Lujinxingiaceae bacterium]
MPGIFAKQRCEGLEAEQSESQPCDWALAFDALIVGRIESVTLTQAPLERAVWSPVREPLFILDDRGLTFQPGSFQCTPAPWASSSLDALKAGVATCAPTTASQLRRMQANEMAQQAPVLAYAATCFDYSIFFGGGSDACTFDLDCDADQDCHLTACTPTCESTADCDDDVQCLPRYEGAEGWVCQ